MQQAVELIRFRVSEARAEAFVSARAAVDTVLKTIPGFLYAQLVHVQGDDWMLLVYWKDRAAVEAAQHITETLPAITEWTHTADAFVSFHTADVRYMTDDGAVRLDA